MQLTDVSLGWPSYHRAHLEIVCPACFILSRSTFCAHTNSFFSPSLRVRATDNMGSRPSPRPVDFFTGKVCSEYWSLCHGIFWFSISSSPFEENDLSLTNESRMSVGPVSPPGNPWGDGPSASHFSLWTQSLPSQHILPHCAQVDKRWLKCGPLRGRAARTHRTALIGVSSIWCRVQGQRHQWCFGEIPIVPSHLQILQFTQERISPRYRGGNSGLAGRSLRVRPRYSSASQCAQLCETVEQFGKVIEGKVNIRVEIFLL